MVAMEKTCPRSLGKPIKFYFVELKDVYFTLSVVTVYGLITVVLSLTAGQMFPAVLTIFLGLFLGAGTIGFLTAMKWGKPRGYLETMLYQRGVISPFYGLAPWQKVKRYSMSPRKESKGKTMKVIDLARWRCGPWIFSGK